MPLRMIELIAKREAIATVPDLLENQEVLGVWLSEIADNKASARILVSADQTETVSDILSQRFGSEDGFRLVLYPVEATIPTPDEKDKENSASQTTTSPAEIKPERISREELYQDLTEAARISKVYLVTVVLSTIVAAVGLIKGNVAIIIGAMVIAPLLGPNVAFSLASTLGDPALAIRSLRALGAGSATSLALSLLLGLFFRIDLGSAELMSRTTVDFTDVAIALAAGSAGTLAYTAGLPTSVIGVMVAVALLPPLVSAGLFIGSGHLTLAVRAFILFVTNVACVNLAGVITFLAQNVRPRTWWETERAKRASRLALGAWLVMILVRLAVILMLRLRPG